MYSSSDEGNNFLGMGAVIWVSRANWLQLKVLMYSIVYNGGNQIRSVTELYGFINCDWPMLEELHICSCDLTENKNIFHNHKC